MAGMEQLEIHSKVHGQAPFHYNADVLQSYLVRWVDVKAQHTISWSIQPQKKSINFGIFKHPGSGNAPTPNLSTSTFEASSAPPTPGVKPADKDNDSSQQQTYPSAVIGKLRSIGLRLIQWHGTCEANQVSSGKYDVSENEGGMYALVFDNTFAKSFSKTATFVLLTYPTDSAPQSNHQVHHFQGTSSGSLTSSRIRSKSRHLIERPGSCDSMPRAGSPMAQVDPSPYQRQENSESSTGSNFFTGILQKRRRKRHQGYARRFFSLDFDSSTLSYYHNKNTLALRGAVPLSLAAIGANGTTREISIDSGAEVWHLRAPDQKDFEAWKKALESASKLSNNRVFVPGGSALDQRERHDPPSQIKIEEERDWAKIEGLVGKIAAARDTARRLARDTDPKYLPLDTPNSLLGSSLDMNRLRDASSAEASPTENKTTDDLFLNGERRSFWRRKTSVGRPSPGIFKRSISAQAQIPSSQSSSNSTERIAVPFPRQSQLLSNPEDNLHDQCLDMLDNLESVVTELKTIVAGSAQRRTPISPIPNLVSSRISMDSQGTQEFFDAEGGDSSQLLTIQHETDDEAEPVDHYFATDEQDISSASEIDDDNSFERSALSGDLTNSTFPPKPKNLAPLPLELIPRRRNVPLPTVGPPSLIGFLRKNVGKDLSTISMPVSANEPISLLQKVAEQLEYSGLLDEAAKESSGSLERLIHIAAFAISSSSAMRVKDRGLRKPFNPMLGETYELVREDRGFRLMAEKVSHRPVRMACQAESDKWSLTQSPMPTQKFWGKSAELVTEGRVRVVVHGTGDRFSWTPATCFLRNLIAGEKYVEPVGSMTITNETTGEQALVTFKTGGMFSGRSEEVVVRAFAKHGLELPLGLVGKWTQSLCIIENGAPRPQKIWSVGELVPDAPKRYGFTTFTASLNEILPRDKDKMPPTDSRWRPDQRAVEEGDVERAEVLKGKLEEGQRERRRILDEQGSEHHPMWFTKLEGLEGEEVWILKTGKDGYWEQRVKGQWKGVNNILAV